MKILAQRKDEEEEIGNKKWQKKKNDGKYETKQHRGKTRKADETENRTTNDKQIFVGLS